MGQLALGERCILPNDQRLQVWVVFLAVMDLFSVSLDHVFHLESKLDLCDLDYLQEMSYLR